MFVVTVTFEIAADQAAAFLTRVCLQASDSLSNKDGCHRFDVCVDRERTERVFLYEIYADAAAFEEHMATPHFKAFDAEVAPMVRAKTVETWELED